MYRNLRKLTIILLGVLPYIILPKCAVTYDFSGGRFGDNLISYAHARWISYKYGIQFIYRPFPDSDKLRMHQLYKPFDLEKQKTFWTIINFKPGNKLPSIKKNDKKNILYVIPYFPISEKDLVRKKWFSFKVDWQDEKFLNILRKEIFPIKAIAKLSFPEGLVSVAVHVRSGSHKDKLALSRSLTNEKGPILIENRRTFNKYFRSPYADLRYPLKFPSDYYYVTQIIKISELLKNKPFYVCIFSDAQDKSKIVEEYKKYVKKPQIIWGYQNDSKDYTSTIIEDFFGLLQFDCLIRADSNFTIMVEKLGIFNICISPKEAQIFNQRIMVTKTIVVPKNWTVD